MSEIPGPSALVARDENSNKENMDLFYEPEKKKIKTEEKEKESALENRLSGILCCAVCLVLPKTCYQVNIFFKIICYHHIDKLILIDFLYCRCVVSHISLSGRKCCIIAK